MLPLLILTSLVGLGLSMGLSDDDGDIANPSFDPDEFARDNQPPDQTGTSNGDLLIGTNSDNTINGNGGEDTISGRTGDDTLYGGFGDDELSGGQGDDHVIGGPGDDLMNLGPGNDVVDTAFGTNELFGDDTIQGRAGDDLISDVDGSNDIDGGTGDDTLIALDGVSALGQVGTDAERFSTDTLTAGDGDDTVFADSGDEVSLGAGEDQLLVATKRFPTGVELPPVMVSDFNVNEDALVLRYYEDLGQDADVRFVHDADAGGVRAFVGAQEVAFLEGVRAEDIGRIDTTLVE